MQEFINNTEQEIIRPKNKRKRKSYYTGRKRKHTVKTQLMVNTEGLTAHKTAYRNGRKQHDYDLYEHISSYYNCIKVEIIVDLG